MVRRGTQKAKGRVWPDTGGHLTEAALKAKGRAARGCSLDPNAHLPWLWWHYLSLEHLVVGVSWSVSELLQGHRLGIGWTSAPCGAHWSPWSGRHFPAEKKIERVSVDASVISGHRACPGLGLQVWGRGGVGPGPRLTLGFLHQVWVFILAHGSASWVTSQLTFR